MAAAVARGPAAAAESVSREANPDVPPGFKTKDVDPARMALMLMADEGFEQNPKNKKANSKEDTTAAEEEE